MESAISGTQRHGKFLDIMRLAPVPLSGEALSRETGVSRQVAAQGIALLRTMGHPILSTARGYVLNVSRHASHFFKVCHTNKQTEDRLVTIVDLGGTVVNVMVNHQVHGKMSVPLNIKNHRDAQLFMNNIKTGKSIPLVNITSGYRFHHVYAEQEEVLDGIEEALRKKHYPAELLSYEMSNDE